MTEQLLDVRDIAPFERHARIFAMFDALAPGASFVLQNDHEPRPLQDQFAAHRSGKFDWTYLEQGPELWRVRIAKVRENVSCCGSCGS